MSVDADTDALAARDLLLSAAREAGALALEYFNPGGRTSARVMTKAGGSPVSDADLAADALLKRRLREALPDAGWLSEETVDDFERLSRRSLIIVDPIDGTRAFVTGDPRWVVSVALIVDERPIAGVVYAPALDETYAAAKGQGATFNGAPIRPAAGWPPRAAAGPKSMIEAMAAELGEAIEIVPRVPALAYRMCLVARGVIDFAISAANSHDWDIAGADMLLEESGARLIDASGERLRYNSRQVSRGALLAASDAAAPRLIQWLSHRHRRFGELTGAGFRLLAFLPPRGQRPFRRAAAVPPPSRKLIMSSVDAKPEDDAKPQRLHLVFGGELKTVGGHEFRDPATLDIVGLFPDYASAESAWRAKAQKTVDSAQTRYFIVHLHRLLEPDLAPPTRTA